MQDRERLKSFFDNHAETVRSRWHDALLAEYPPETVRFFKKTGDQIANPVGHVIKDVVDEVVSGLSSGKSAAEAAAAMYPLIRIKAVQDFTPSRAVAGVLELKRIIRGIFENADEEGAREVVDLMDPVVDEMLCTSFDHYMECRAKLSEIKEDELKRNLFMLLRKSEMVQDSAQGEG